MKTHGGGDHRFFLLFLLALPTFSTSSRSELFGFSVAGASVMETGAGSDERLRMQWHT